MTATAIPAPFHPARPLLDTRPRRGKHRAPLAGRILAAQQRARGAFTLGAMSVGALAAAVLS